MILLMANMLLAIEQVPRRTTSTDKDTREVATEVKQVKKSNDDQEGRPVERAVEKKEKQQDRFIDNNSNGVNDRREDDFQTIKTKKSKHKDMIDRQKVERPEPKQREKTSTNTREKNSSSNEKKKAK